MAEWRIGVSVNYAIFGSDCGSSPFQSQTIIWNNADLLLIEEFGIYFSIKDQTRWVVKTVPIKLYELWVSGLVVHIAVI